MARLYPYGTGRTIAFKLLKFDDGEYATSSDWTPAAGDVKISKDAGTEANVGTLPSYSNGWWRLTLTNAELQAAEIAISIVDTATKVITDDGIVIHTYGHASAMYPAFPSDVTKWNGTAVATPDTAGYPKITIKSGTGAGELSLSSGVAKSNLSQILGTTLTETVGGYLAAAFKVLFDVASPVFTTASVNQTANNNTLLAALDGRLTSARAGYLDNLNAGGVVASQADVLALNTSASRRSLLVVLEEGWELPESSTITKTIYLHTFDGDGAPVNADSSPTFTITGSTTGDLSTNLSVVSNPATGVYKWTYTLTAGDTLEDVEIVATPTIGGDDFLVRRLVTIVDEFGTKWTATHAAQLAALYNMRPSRGYFVGTDNATGEAQWETAWDAEVQSECNDALAAFAWSGISVGSVAGAVGSISGVTFPANFSSLDIDADGKLLLQSNAISAGVMSTDVIGASEFSAAAVNKIATRLIPFFQLMMRSDAEAATDLASALAEINANTGTGTGTYANTTHSLEYVGDLVAADHEVAAGTPLQLKLKKAGTSTVLLTKNLTQYGGDNVAAMTDRIGNMIQPA